MGNLELIARIKIRPGQIEGFKAQAGEIMRLVREQDTRTIRYDWFINTEGTECEVHEAYDSEEGIMEHVAHIVGARNRLFAEYAYDHRMSVFGDVSQQFVDLVHEHADGGAVFSFLQGLDATGPAALADSG